MLHLIGPFLMLGFAIWAWRREKREFTSMFLGFALILTGRDLMMIGGMVIAVFALLLFIIRKESGGLLQ